MNSHPEGSQPPGSSSGPPGFGRFHFRKLGPLVKFIFLPVVVVLHLLLRNGGRVSDLVVLTLEILDDYLFRHQGEGHVAQAALDERISAADEARARVLRAERSLDMQRNQLAYAELHAEKDGVISALLAEAGQVVATGQTIARVARLDELEGVVAIPEQKLNEASASRASVSLWPSTGRQYEARLREISPQADQVARTFEARFSIPAADDQVGLGKTATVTLTPNETRSVARLPLSAVMNDAAGPMVWAVSDDGGKLERRPIVINSYTQDSVLIASGLKANERVVSLGVHRLDQTMPVRVVETQSVAAIPRDLQQQ